MTPGLEILRLAGEVAEHSAQRQGLIAQNVANADTPGYRARDIADFSEIYARGLSPSLDMRQTRDGHLGPLANQVAYRIVEDVPLGAEAPNGNTVSLEDQMTRSVGARQMHDLAMGVYSKTLDILRLGLQRR